MGAEGRGGARARLIASHRSPSTRAVLGRRRRGAIARDRREWSSARADLRPDRAARPRPRWSPGSPSARSSCTPPRAGDRACPSCSRSAASPRALALGSIAARLNDATRPSRLRHERRARSDRRPLTRPAQALGTCARREASSRCRGRRRRLRAQRRAASASSAGPPRGLAGFARTSRGGWGMPRDRGSCGRAAAELGVRLSAHSRE